MDDDSQLECMIEQFKHQDGSVNGRILKDLGDSLREESVRSSRIIHDTIPNIIDAVIDVFSRGESSEELKLESLRVVINILAFNDRNRSTVIAIDKPLFWTLLNEQLVSSEDDGIKTRIVLLLSQFIYDTEEKDVFVAKLYQLGFYTSLVRSYDGLDIYSDLEGHEKHIELLHELITVNRDTINQDNEGMTSQVIAYGIELIEKSLTSLTSDNQITDEFQTILGRIFQILATLTSFEQISGINSIPHLFQRLVAIFLSPKPYITDITVKRSYVNVVCNVIYIKNYTHLEEDLELIIDTVHESVLGKGSLDPYLMCACSVFIGNYIHDRTSLEKVKSMIEDKVSWKTFTTVIFQEVKINDVFLIQSLQAFINVMDHQIATLILSQENYPCLLTKYNKVILDNKDFYPEILTQYLKFIYKLVRHRFLLNQDEDDNDNVSDDILSYYDLWNSIIEKCDDSYLQLYLLEAFITHYDPAKDASHLQFIRSLLTSSVTKFTPQSQSNVELVVQKLKALGIFNHILLSKDIGLYHIMDKFYNNDDEIFVNDYLQPYEQFLVQLRQTIQSNTTHDARDELIKNNAKFIAGSTLPLIRDLVPEITPSSDKHPLLMPKLDEVTSLCKDIVEL